VLRAFAACACIALATACYSTPQPNCSFVCGPNNECPADYACGMDHICHRLSGNVLLACEVADGPSPPDSPVSTPDSPIVVTPDSPVITPDAPPVETPDSPVITPDSPVEMPDSPPPPPDSPLPMPDAPPPPDAPHPDAAPPLDAPTPDA
jgi:hypothetical protein